MAIHFITKGKYPALVQKIVSETEKYREQALATDIKQARLGILLLIIPLVLFLFNDFQFFGLSTEFYSLAFARVGFLILSVFLLAYLTKFKSYRSYEYAIFIWGLAGIILTTLINATRPQSFLFHIIQMIIIVFIAYLVIPQRLAFKTTVALIGSIGELVLVLTIQSLTVPILFSVLFSVILANVVGFSTSRLLESLRVNEYRAKKEIIDSERRYREFADSLPEIAFELNEKANLTFVNKKATDLLGYTKSELEQINMLKLIDPEYHEKAKQNFNRIIQDQKSSGNEYIFVRKDGTKFPGIVFSERIIKNKKEPPAIRGILINLSEIQNTQSKLSLLNDKLNIIGKLTRHDVNNKLTAVRGYSYLLKKKYADNADIVAGLEKIEQAVNESERIFEFDRIYEQIGIEELKYIGLKTTVNEAVSLHAGLNLKVINECQEVRLLADSGLRKLFFNFVDNSKKYGEKTTTIKVHCKLIEQDKLRVTYEDDGIGISKQNKQKLFTEGFSTGGSTGFGMFLTKKMMDIYGWEIQETGELGEGVRFEITIPKTNKTGQNNYHF